MEKSSTKHSPTLFLASLIHLIREKLGTDSPLVWLRARSINFTGVPLFTKLEPIIERIKGIQYINRVIGDCPLN